MKTRIFQLSLIAAVSLFFMSGCGLFSQQSQRYISETHWGSYQNSAVAQDQQATQPEAKNAVEEAAEESAGTKAGEGGEATAKVEAEDGGDAAADTTNEPSEATASTGNVGATAQSQSPDAKNMTLYIAYYEHTTIQNNLTGDKAAAPVKSHLRICQLEEDNSLTCSENPELERMLNPHLQRK